MPPRGGRLFEEPPEGGKPNTVQKPVVSGQSVKISDRTDPIERDAIRLELSCFEIPFVWSLLFVPLIRRVSATHAGTAEPMGVSPPEAVAYQVLVSPPSPSQRPVQDQRWQCPSHSILAR